MEHSSIMVFSKLVDWLSGLSNRYFPGAFEILKEITSTKIASHEFFTTINKDDVFNVFKRRTGLPFFRDKVLDKFSIIASSTNEFLVKQSN